MSAPTPDQARALIEAGRRLYEDGLLGGTAGNLSVRVPGADTLLVTATGVHKGRLQPADVRAVPLTAGDPDRDAGATSELPFHRACYRADPSVGAVVHTHAPALTAVGIRQLPLTGALPELEAAVGRVAVVDPLPSGSRALAEGVG
ncbi:MAG: class II aldolase/adducin family protein, partial [Gemmatimonadetes bacterium]